MPDPEVITLQFGNFANYVGAHFWNFQDELLGLAEKPEVSAAAAQINPDVLYCVGENLQGQQTYTPRLLLFDLSGALGGVSAHGAGYSDATASAAATASSVVSTWGGGVAVHRAEPVQRSAFLEHLDQESEEAEEAMEDRRGSHARAEALEQAARSLDSGDGVRYWTDYLKSYLHPRSIYQIPGVWHGVADYAGFGEGGSVLRTDEAREEVMDRLRQFVEGCDHLGGFQCWTDDMSGFGQLTADMLTEMRDDYSNVPVLLFPVRQYAEYPANAGSDRQTNGRRRWQLNLALSLALLSEVSSVYAPIAPPANPQSLPHLHWNPHSKFHASALCASILDTLTLPYRLASNPPRSPLGYPTGRVEMGSLAQLLAPRHIANCAAVAGALPCPAIPAEHDMLAASDRRTEGGRDRPGIFGRGTTASWTPGIRAGADGCTAEAIVLRGPRRAGAPLNTEEAAAALDAALMREGVRCIQQRCVVPQPLPIPLPFPRIFASTVLQFGDVLTDLQAPLAAQGHLGANGVGNGTTSSGHVECVPVLTRLANTAAFGRLAEEQLQRFQSAASSAGGRAMLSSWGVGQDEMLEVEERLHALAHAYSGEDSD
ncbi:hypothetical protein WJX72_012443 [[Myrmecia] bisecta]|uniref:Misato n=1 Tax=[Myrmecia] bisecta TaxID=41462 RepID=A0AAW1PU32_9CHLO